MEVERALLVVTGDREDLLEDGLQAGVGPLAGGGVRLEKLDVGVDLDFDQVRGG
jgi:hypothetical protein